MIKALIFDFGGVLVRTEDGSGRRRLEERLGLANGEVSQLVFGSDNAYQASLGVLPEETMWAQLAEHLRLNPEEMEDFRREFWSGDRLDLELVKFVAGLKPRLKTAILSNAWSGARQLFVQTHALDIVFDEIFISAELGIVKPDPEIYQRVLSGLGVAPEEAIFVDDFPENITAARELGLNSVQFRSTQQTIDDITNLLSKDQ